MQIVEIIQVGDLEGYSIRLGRDKKYYLFSNDIVCVSKGKNTIDEVRSIIKCQDPTLYSLVNKEKQSAVEWLVEELGEYFPHEIGGIHLMVERAKAMEERRYSKEDMKIMYDMSCGNIGLGELKDQTENNARFTQFLNRIKETNGQ